MDYDDDGDDVVAVVVDGQMQVFGHCSVVVIGVGADDVASAGADGVGADVDGVAALVGGFVDDADRHHQLGW